MMQKRKCIKVRLATQPYIRGPGVISVQQSSNSTIYCKDGVDNYRPLDSRTNVKKSDHIYSN